MNLAVGDHCGGFAMSKKPVEPGSDQHDHIGLGQNQRAGCSRGLRVIIRQEPFRHRHRQKRDACLLNERANVSVSLCVRSAFAENNERTLCARQQVEGALDRFGGRDLPGSWIDNAHQRLRPCICIERCTENICGQVQIDPTGPSRYGGTDGACDSNTDIFRLANPEGCLGVRFCRIHLIQFFVVALLEIDNLTVARSADLDHGKTIGGRIGQRHQAVQETWCGDGQTNPRLLGQIAGDRGCISGRLFMPKADVPYSFCLSQPGQICDRNSRNAINRVDSVELQGIDYEVKSVGQSRRFLFVR